MMGITSGICERLITTKSTLVLYTEYLYVNPLGPNNYYTRMRKPPMHAYIRAKYNVRPTVNFRASNGKGRSNDYMTGHFVRTLL